MSMGLFLRFLSLCKVISVVVRRLSKSHQGNRRSSKRLVAHAEGLCYPSRCGGVSALGLGLSLWTLNFAVNGIGIFLSGCIHHA